MSAPLLLETPHSPQRTRYRSSGGLGPLCSMTWFSLEGGQGAGLQLHDLEGRGGAGLQLHGLEERGRDFSCMV